VKRRPSAEHLEDAVILAYLDGELSRATERKARSHLNSCWNCRSAAAELEILAQTAYALLSGQDEDNTVQTETAKAEFLRRKAKVDETWDNNLRQSTSMLFHRPASSIGRNGIRPLAPC
jgi:anti-sigma factor RsiW